MSYPDARKPLPVLTCKSCKHFHPAVQAIPRGAVLLSEENPPMGECRERLHSTQLPHQQGKIFYVGYPPVPEDYPACGQHKPVVAVNSN